MQTMLNVFRASVLTVLQAKRQLQPPRASSLCSQGASSCEVELLFIHSCPEDLGSYVLRKR